MRGKARLVNCLIVVARIIPAGAGKRLSTISCSALSWDHPRGCGEKLIAMMVSPVIVGSSPRVRGKALQYLILYQQDFIIPAGAGKSRRIVKSKLHVKDHPRGCGEKIPAFGLAISAPGSSPRVRGKVRASATYEVVDGIIPAGAGKSGEEVAGVCLA